MGIFAPSSVAAPMIFACDPCANTAMFKSGMAEETRIVLSSIFFTALLWRRVLPEIRSAISDIAPMMAFELEAEYV